MAKTHDFGRIIARELAEDPELEMLVEQKRLHYTIAMEVHAAREEAQMTQQQLASAADMKQSGVARIEDADYAGHSINALHRLAWAMGKRVIVELVDRPRFVPVAENAIAVKVIWQGTEVPEDQKWLIGSAPRF